MNNKPQVNAWGFLFDFYTCINLIFETNLLPMYQTAGYMNVINITHRSSKTYGEGFINKMKIDFDNIPTGLFNQS